MSGRWLRLVGFGIAAGTVVLAVVLAARFGTDPGLVESPLIGQPAPDFDLPTLAGDGTVALTELEGDIVVVNFFASWCLECRREHADLVATADAFSDRGVTFVQIGYQEEPSASLAYLDEAGTSEATFCRSRQPHGHRVRRFRHTGDILHRFERHGGRQDHR